INNLSGLIEFKRYLGQVVEIGVWMRAHQQRNLWLGKPDFSCRFHWAMLSECSSRRSRASQSGKIHSWELLVVPCRSRGRSSYRSPSSPPGTIGRAVSVVEVSGTAERGRASAAVQLQ